MDIQVELHDGIAVVAPRGRIDCNTSAQLERQLLTLLEPASRGIVIDFAAVDYISSAGLRVMLVLAKRLRGGRGALVLCRLNDLIQDVFKMSGFNKVIAIAATRDEALATLSRTAGPASGRPGDPKPPESKSPQSRPPPRPGASLVERPARHDAASGLKPFRYF